MMLTSVSLRCCCRVLAAAAFLQCFPGSSGAADAPQDAAAKAKTVEIPFKSHDGHDMFGKLTLPVSSGLHPVVVYVQTAEAMTADMKRPNPRGGTFNYFDLYREKLPELNVGFFGYEGRGIHSGDAPPRYERIDWDVYNTSTIDNKVRDVLTAVRLVQRQPGVDPSQIFLIGASEGTLLAAQAASRAPSEIRGLILYAVMSSTLRHALKYMTADGNFLMLRGYFDTDKDNRISQKEFDDDPRRLRRSAIRPRIPERRGRLHD